MIDVKIENNTAKIEAEFGQAMNRALYAIGVTAQSDITDYMSKPDFTGRDIVDTGRLRASISFVTPEDASGANSGEAKTGDALGKNLKEEKTVILGTNVEYGAAVNNGNGKNRPARKFMENGIEPNFKKYKEIAEDVFKGKI